MAGTASDGFRDDLTGGRRDQLLGMLRLEVFVVEVFVLVPLMLVVLMFTVSGIMFGVFLSHIRGEFRPVGSAAGFDFRRFLFREFRDLGNCCFLSFFGNFLCLFFGFFLFEFGTTDDGIDFRCFRSLFLLGLDETGGERGNLILVQISVIPGGFRAVASRPVGRLRECAASGGSFIRGSHGLPRRCCFGFGASIGQEPAGQPTGEPARNVAAAWSGGWQIAGWARRSFFDSGPLFLHLMLNTGSRRW